MSQRRILLIVSVACLLAGLFDSSPVSAASCEALTSLVLPQTTITLARSVALAEPSFEDMFRYWIFEDPK